MRQVAVVSRIGEKGVKTGKAATAMAGAVLVTRQVHFNASHRLHNPKKSKEWNRRMFGMCNSPNFHGHNYVLEVSVLGKPNPDTGYVIDLGILKKILEHRVTKQCDHKNLNLDVPFLKGMIPSSENVVKALWDQIEPGLAPHMDDQSRLYRVRLYESPRNFFDYLGPCFGND